MISNNLRKRLFTSLGLFFLVYFIFIYNFIQVYFLIILSVLSILEFAQLTKKITMKNFNFFLINFIFIIFILIFSFMFFLFSNIMGLKIILLILLVGCIASDIGGYIFGKIFKGPKLTKISPNKTYSGAIGAIILCTILMLTLFNFFIESINFRIIIISIITSVSCQLGDLLFSFLKRKAKTKDTGNFFPGHGGVLDRLDGIFLGIPLGFLSLIILN